MLLLMLSALAGEPVTPVFGVEWRPLSRADLVWVEEGRTSGTAVGEHDGVARPLFSGFAGFWANRYVGMVFGLGMARLTSTSKADDIYVQRHWGVLRPSLDLRFGWMERRVQRPVPWFLLGAYGDIPSARDVSNGYTEDEQAAADASAETERLRLGGFGGRLGVGVDYRILPGFMVGLQVSAGLHRSSYQGGDGRLASVWVATDAALLLSFEWPPEVQEARRQKAAARAAAVEAASP